MTDLDLERLGDVWRQRPEPKELEEIRRAAEAVRRRARWLQVVDIVAALVVSGVVLWMVLANPKTDTLIVGGGAILILLGSQIRSRRFRQQELRSLTGSAEQMLDQSIERVRASLKRARSALFLLPATFLVGHFVGYITEGGSPGPLRTAIASRPGLGQIIIVGSVVVLAAAVFLVLRNLHKNRRELERLSALRAAYSDDENSATG
jgi:hypothetical protein